jgi:hypothetical protein
VLDKIVLPCVLLLDRAHASHRAPVPSRPSHGGSALSGTGRRTAAHTPHISARRAFTADLFAPQLPITPHTSWLLLAQASALMPSQRSHTPRSWIPTRPWDSFHSRPPPRRQSLLRHTQQRPPSRPCALTPRGASADATPRSSRWPMFRHRSRFGRSTLTPAASSHASKRPMRRQTKYKRYALLDPGICLRERGRYGSRPASITKTDIPLCSTRISKILFVCPTVH